MDAGICNFKKKTLFPLSASHPPSPCVLVCACSYVCVGWKHSRYVCKFHAQGWLPAAADRCGGRLGGKRQCEWINRTAFIYESDWLSGDRGCGWVVGMSKGKGKEIMSLLKRKTYRSKANQCFLKETSYAILKNSLFFCFFPSPTPSSPTRLPPPLLCLSFIGYL